MNTQAWNQMSIFILTQSCIESATVKIDVKHSCFHWSIQHELRILRKESLKTETGKQEYPLKLSVVPASPIVIAFGELALYWEVPDGRDH